MSADVNQGPGGAPGSISAIQKLTLLTARLIRWWALLGGLIVAGLAVMSAYSATMNIFFNAPFSPDYELSKHMMAIAIFAFLPYCQLEGANVTVDIFTEGLSPAAKAAMSLFSAILAVLFSVLLLRQMSLGFDGYLRYPEVTPVLRLPLWTAFPPILVSLVLLLAAALITLNDDIRAILKKPKWIKDDGILTAE